MFSCIPFIINANCKLRCRLGWRWSRTDVNVDTSALDLICLEWCIYAEKCPAIMWPQCHLTRVGDDVLVSNIILTPIPLQCLQAALEGTYWGWMWTQVAVTLISRAIPQNVSSLTTRDSCGLISIRTEGGGGVQTTCLSVCTYVALASSTCADPVSRGGCPHASPSAHVGGERLTSLTAVMHIGHSIHPAGMYYLGSDAFAADGSRSFLGISSNRFDFAFKLLVSFLG